MIFVSAGHRKSRQGASFKDFTEWREATLWCDIIAKTLGRAAISVPPTGLRGKVEFINKHNPGKSDVAIEIHFNSAVNSHGVNVGNGCETLYCPGSANGKEAAEYVQETARLIWPPSRGVKEGWYQMNPEKGPDYFLKATNCPAIIFEPEFVHNWKMIAERREVGCSTLAAALAVWG